MGKESDSKLFAFLGVLLGLIGFLIVMLARKNDKYAMYYGKQGLVLFIAYAIIYAVGMLMPFIGLYIIRVLSAILLILWIFGIVYSLSGKEKPVPIIGRFAEKFKF